jgi:hypothetical protein
MVQHRTERKRSAVRRGDRRVSWPLAAKPNIRRVAPRSGDGVGVKFCVLTRGDLSASACGSTGIHQGRKDEMKKGREESDGRTVPEGRRKPVQTAAGRGGRATTASEEVRQLGLFSETADSPKGADAQADGGQPSPVRSGVPKSGNEEEKTLPAMKMEEVASEGNLRRAFEKVRANKGAPGPDRQSVREVGEGLGTLIPALSRSLLEGTYRPGDIRRVWIPSTG